MSKTSKALSDAWDSAVASAPATETGAGGSLSGAWDDAVSKASDSNGSSQDTESYWDKVNRTGAAFDNSVGSGPMGYLRTLGAAGGAALNIGSGVAGDIAGFGTSVATQNPAKGAAVRNAMTYTPGATGQAALDYVGALTSPVAKVLNKPIQALDAAGHPILAQGARATEDVAALSSGEAIKGVAGALSKAGVADPVLDAARAKGLQVPPATTNPTLVNRALQGIGGEAAINQTARVKNMGVFSDMAREELDLPKYGLPANAPLIPETTQAVRSAAYQSGYEPIKAQSDIPFGPKYEQQLNALNSGSSKLQSVLPKFQNTAGPQIQEMIDSLKPVGGKMDGDVAVELSSNLRQQASNYFRSASRTGDAVDGALARAYKGAATTVENAVQDHLNNTGQTDLAQGWSDARTTIAKSHDIEDAMDGAGNIDPTKIAKMGKKAPGRLSGNLDLMADFASRFPQVSKPFSGPSPFMSASDAMVGAGLEAMTGNPAALAYGPGRYLLRKGLMSGPGQALGEPGIGLRKAGSALGSTAPLAPPGLVGSVQGNQ